MGFAVSYRPELAIVWTAVVVIVGSVVCGVLIIASVAVGFSFLVVPILVAELMLLAAVYLVRRALVPEEVAHEQHSAWYVGSGVCLLLIVSSVATGLSFLVVPLLVAELVLLGGVYVTRQALWAENDADERQPAWKATAGYAPPRVTDRLYEPHPGGYRLGGRAYERGNPSRAARSAAERRGQPRRVPPAARRTRAAHMTEPQQNGGSCRCLDG